MLSMTKLPTKIHGAWLLKPKVFGDARGFFLESWNREIFREMGLDLDFVQDNHSRSSKGVLRGLHYQIGDAAQGKLVSVGSGRAFSVMVDLRQSSPSFGRWDGYTLTADTHEQLYIPPGCAHGFLVLSEMCDFHYKVTTPYNLAADRSLRWNDPDLAIAWPLAIGSEPLLSGKDQAAPGFAECEKYA
jgi:dTDP-4-dehydrorhamnose 3,5-epimerase